MELRVMVVAEGDDKRVAAKQIKIKGLTGYVGFRVEAVLGKLVAALCQEAMAQIRANDDDDDMPEM